jgi:hypothetical protein
MEEERKRPGPGLIGPSSQAVTKRPKALDYEHLYVQALPSCSQYELSFMHAAHVTHVLATPRTKYVPLFRIVALFVTLHSLLIFVVCRCSRDYLVTSSHALTMGASSFGRRNQLALNLSNSIELI